MSITRENKSLCPSSRASDDAKLLGIRQKDGRVAILPDPLEINVADFTGTLPEGVLPEQYFRFAGQCQKSKCKQWGKGGCSIATTIVKYLDQLADIPQCSIRHLCRWHQQQGDNACKVCSYIITDISSAEINDYFDEANRSKSSR